jgi:hypothetical protein
MKMERTLKNALPSVRRTPLMATLVIQSLIVFNAHAADCRLADVNFSGMNEQQAKALVSVGGVCGTQSAQTAIKFGSRGYAIFNERKVSFLDLASEDPLELRGKPVEIYGYFFSFSEADPNRTWGYRFDISLYEGEFQQFINTVTSTKPDIDILIIPSRNKQYAEPLDRTLQSMRRQAFRNLSVAQQGKALLKINGTFNVYSNTGKLYIAAESIEVAATASK